MTLKELNFFYELSENPNVSLVAKELEISQSAVSLAIKSLEEKLNEQLFDRVGKKLILNERGRYFKDMTYKHFNALNDAKNIFQENKIAGNLKVAASKTIANHIMPNIYYSFLSKFEKVKLNIHSTNSSEIIEKIKNGTLDIGFIESSCEDIDIKKEKLKDDELIIVTSDEKASKKTYIDSIKKRWILREVGSGTRDTFVKQVGEQINKLDIFMELYEFDEIKKVLLKNPNSVTAISKVAVKDELDKKELFKIELINISFKREFYVIYHKNKVQNKLFELFKNYAKEQISKNKF